MITQSACFDFSCLVCLFKFIVIVMATHLTLYLKFYPQVFMEYFAMSMLPVAGETQNEPNVSGLLYVAVVYKFSL